MNVEASTNSEAPLLVHISLSWWFLLLIDVGDLPSLVGLTSLLVELDLLVLIIMGTSDLENSTLGVSEVFTSHVHDLHPS